MKRFAARIDGRRLLLRELSLWDMWPIIRLLRNKDLTRFHVAPVRAFRWPRLVRKLIRLFRLAHTYSLAFWHRLRPGATRGQYKLAIVYKDTGQVVGVVTLTDVFFDKDCASIGIWVGRDFWAKGVMYEAEALIIRWAFETLGLERISGNVHPENVASIITMKKLGFDVVDAYGQVKDNTGKTVDMWKVVLSRERFKAA
jgi:ribosomal-protein-alanine N-acetyltransferase